MYHSREPFSATRILLITQVSSVVIQVPTKSLQKSSNLKAVVNASKAKSEMFYGTNVCSLQCCSEFFGRIC